MERGRVNSRLTAYRRKKDEAMKVCTEQLAAHKAPYVALSGGKDSVAMAFLVDAAARSAGCDFTLWSHISDASFPGTEETCREVAERLGRHIDIYTSPFSAYDALDSKKRAAFGKTGVFFGSLREYAKDKDLAFVGVRARESKRRTKAAKAHGMVFHSSIGDVTVVNPLQWFTVYDVASLLYETDAPIHPIYKKFSIDDGIGSGGEPRFIRLSYITSRDLLDKGTAVFLKTNYPDKFNLLLRYFPEIGNYC